MNARETGKTRDTQRGTEVEDSWCGYKLVSFDNSVGKKEQKGSANGDAKTMQIKPGDLAIAKVGADQSSHHGAGDPNQDGDEHSTRVLSRHDDFCQDPRNEAEHDPGYDAQ